MSQCRQSDMCELLCLLYASSVMRLQLCPVGAATNEQAMADFKAQWLDAVAVAAKK